MKHWFNREDYRDAVGNWTLNGTHLTFAISLERGEVHYHGEYLGNTLRLNWFSQVTGRQGQDRYQYLDEDLINQLPATDATTPRIVSTSPELLVTTQVQPSEPPITRDGTPNWQDVSPWVICPSCRKVGPPGSNSLCPRCMLPLSGGVEVYMTSWDDSKKQYRVRLVLPAQIITEREADIIRAMPQEVADRSSCSCGSPLDLADHTVQVQDGKLTFEGVYACLSCRAPKSLASKLKRGASRLWRDTTKIHVGVDGVTYEKGTPEDPA